MSVSCAGDDTSGQCNQQIAQNVVSNTENCYMPFPYPDQNFVNIPFNVRYDNHETVNKYNSQQNLTVNNPDINYCLPIQKTDKGIQTLPSMQKTSRLRLIIFVTVNPVRCLIITCRKKCT